MKEAVVDFLIQLFRRNATGEETSKKEISKKEIDPIGNIFPFHTLSIIWQW